MTHMPSKECRPTIRRIATLPFLEIGFACGVTFALKVSSLARNRLIFGRWAAVGSVAL